MISKLFFWLFFLIPCFSMGQPNCNVYLWKGDTLQYEACELSYKFNDYYQFDMKGIAILDSCIAICPYYAYAIYEKGVVYLKAGNFLGWDKYINLAVELDPLTYLTSRASCRGKFFADYAGAIRDIDLLDSLVSYDIGHTHDGTYHLLAYQALCYRQLGNYHKAIELFEARIASDPDFIGFYDYLHLGVCYQKLNDHDSALACFQKQVDHNTIAEGYYYAAISYKKIGEEEKYEQALGESLRLLKIKQKMVDPYHVLEDEIFLMDIESLKASDKALHNN